MNCTDCKSELEKREDSELTLVFYYCKSCHGKVVLSSDYSEHLSPKIIDAIKDSPINRLNTKVCPSCLDSMNAKVFDPNSLNLELDICPSCQLIWFDSLELTWFKEKTMQEQRDYLRLRAQELILLHKQKTEERIDELNKSADRSKGLVDFFGRLVFGWRSWR